MEIWDVVKETYSKVHDAARIYEIKTKLSAAKHIAWPVTEYSKFYRGYGKKWMVINAFKWIARLNAEFDFVRVQIVEKEVVGKNDVVI